MYKEWVTSNDDFSLKEATFSLKLAECMQKTCGNLNPWLPKNRSNALICDFYWQLSQLSVLLWSHAILLSWTSCNTCVFEKCWRCCSSPLTCKLAIFPSCTATMCHCPLGLFSLHTLSCKAQMACCWRCLSVEWEELFIFADFLYRVRDKRRFSRYSFRLLSILPRLCSDALALFQVKTKKVSASDRQQDC